MTTYGLPVIYPADLGARVQRFDAGDLTDLYYLDDDGGPDGGAAMYDGSRMVLELAASIRLTPDELTTAAWLSDALRGDVLAGASVELVRYEVAFALTFCGVGRVRDELDQVRAGLPGLDPSCSLAENTARTAGRLAHWTACADRVREAFSLAQTGAVHSGGHTGTIADYDQDSNTAGVVR